MDLRFGANLSSQTACRACAGRLACLLNSTSCRSIAATCFRRECHRFFHRAVEIKARIDAECRAVIKKTATGAVGSDLPLSFSSREI